MLNRKMHVFGVEIALGCATNRAGRSVRCWDRATVRYALLVGDDDLFVGGDGGNIWATGGESGNIMEKRGGGGDIDLGVSVIDRDLHVVISGAWHLFRSRCCFVVCFGVQLGVREAYDPCSHNPGRILPLCGGVASAKASV